MQKDTDEIKALIESLSTFPLPDAAIMLGVVQHIAPELDVAEQCRLVGISEDVHAELSLMLDVCRGGE